MFSMPLPIDLVLVRHGTSEGNAAKRRSEKGDHSAIKLLHGRHTASFRLTEQGRRQAAQAGAWLRKEFYPTYGFDRFYASEYARALETAGLLGLPNVKWYTDFYISERDWGELDVLPEDERQEKFGEALRMRDTEPFFWAPPNGESFANLCLRIDRMLATLARECSNKKVVIVCHGEVMWAFRIRLERMSKELFKELHLSKDERHKIHNCQIIHYSRRDPHDPRLGPHQYYQWMRMVRPTQTPVFEGEWQKIIRRSYTNEELLEMVSKTPALVA
jgi:NAD+ kinase